MKWNLDKVIYLLGSFTEIWTYQLETELMIKTIDLVFICISSVNLFPSHPITIYWTITCKTIVQNIQQMSCAYFFTEIFDQWEQAKWELN